MIGFTTSYISELLLTYQDAIRQIGAILIIFFGLVIVGVFNFKFLMKDKKITFKNRPGGLCWFFYNRNGILSWMDSLYRSNISYCVIISCNQPRCWYDYDD